KDNGESLIAQQFNQLLRLCRLNHRQSRSEILSSYLQMGVHKAVNLPPDRGVNRNKSAQKVDGHSPHGYLEYARVSITNRARVVSRGRICNNDVPARQDHIAVGKPRVVQDSRKIGGIKRWKLDIHILNKRHHFVIE